MSTTILNNELTATGNSILNTHVDLQSLETAESYILDEDRATLALSEQKKKKRTAKELADVDRQIEVLYYKAFSEAAIAKKVDIGEDYVTKHILSKIRNGILEAVKINSEIFTGGTSLKKLASVFGFRGVDAKTSFEAELQGKTIIINILDQTKEEGHNNA